MKIKDRKGFGDLQSDGLEEDLFSIADIAQLLLFGLRRCHRIDAEPGNQSGSFGFGARIDVGSILKKRAAKFRESLFSSLMEAAIDEGRRCRNRVGMDSSRLGDEDAAVSGQQFGGIAFESDSRPVGHLGCKNNPNPGDARQCPTDSQTLHRTIMGQGQEVVPAGIAGCHRVAGQCARHSRGLGEREHCTERSAPALGLTRVARRLWAFRTGEPFQSSRPCRQSARGRNEYAASRGLHRHGVPRKNSLAGRTGCAGGRSENQPRLELQFGNCIRLSRHRTARNGGLPCQLQRLGSNKTHREN